MSSVIIDEGPLGGGGDQTTGTLIVTGTAAAGGSLTASLTNASDPQGPVTVTYMWQVRYLDFGVPRWQTLYTGANFNIGSESLLVGETIRVVATATDPTGATTLFEGEPLLVVDLDTPGEDEAQGTLVVTGVAEEGGSLTASLNNAFDPDGTPTVAYQWQELVGGTWTNLVGRTAATLTIPDDQSFVGKQVRVVATTTDPLGGTTEFLGQARTILDVPDIVDTEATGTLAVFGQAQESGQLVATLTDLVDPDGLASANYQWQVLNGSTWADIAGANSALYNLPDDQSIVGKQVRVVATSTDPLGGTTQFVGDALTIANYDDQSIGLFELPDSVREGDVVTPVGFLTTDEDGTVREDFQWQELVGGLWQDIPGATSNEFGVPYDQSYVGKQIRLVMTREDSFGNVQRFEASGRVVENVDDGASGTLAVTGNAQEGSTLTAALTSVIDPDGATSVSYRWQQYSFGDLGTVPTWVDIPGANAASFTIPANTYLSLVGSQVRVVATTTDPYGGTTEFEGEALYIADGEVEATGDLEVTGTAAEGGSLTAKLKDVYDPDGEASTSYQWQELVAGTWTNLVGRTAATLSIPDDQSFVGKQVRVVATTTDPAGGTTEFFGQAQTIANVDDPAVGTVSISGTVQEGGSIAAVLAASDPDVALTYDTRWQILEGNEWRDIPFDGNIITPNLVLNIPSDQSYVGKQVRVVVTLNDKFGGTTEFTSQAQTVANVEDEATGTLAVTGAAEEGGSLTATLNGLVDQDGAVTTAFQWQELVAGTWTNISGQTTATLSIPGDQSFVGKQVRVVATTTDPFGGTTEFLGQAQTIANVNDAPVAANDQASVLEDKSVTGNVISGTGGADRDADGDILSVVGLRNAGGAQGALGQALKGAYGTLQLNANGTYSYVADGDIVDALPAGRGLTDVFTYTVSDGKGGTSTATLSIAVTTTDDVVGRTMGGRDLSFKGSSSDEVVNGNGLANTIYGGSGSDRLFGLDGDDTLFGENGWDFLFGGLGKDRLSGGNGNDLLVGGAGNDVLTGGEGADVFQFGLTGSIGESDVITDFATNDRIQLVDGLTITGFTVQNGSTMLALSNGGSVTLAGFAGLTDPGQILMPPQDAWWG